MAKRSDVGYRRPPKERQFKKGQSGNPSGRPKGTINLATALTRTLSQTIEVEEDGKKETITKMEAAVRALVDEALTGSMQAFRVLVVLNHLLQDPSSPAAASELEAADQKILDMMVRRFSTASGE